LIVYDNLIIRVFVEGGSILGYRLPLKGVNFTLAKLLTAGILLPDGAGKSQ